MVQGIDPGNRGSIRSGTSPTRCQATIPQVRVGAVDVTVGRWIMIWESEDRSHVVGIDPDELGIDPPI